MPATLLYGSTNKARYEVAKKIGKSWAKELVFVEVDRKNMYEELRKLVVTSTLQNTPRLFFIDDVEELSFKQAMQLTKFIKESSHVFVLSTSVPYKVPKLLRKMCLTEQVGEEERVGLFPALNILMSEPDREKVREYLSRPDVSIGQILYVLKDNVWHGTPEMFGALESCIQKLYKVDEAFLISVLAYMFPPKKLFVSFSKDRKEFLDSPMNSILGKIQNAYKTSISEALSLFEIIRNVVKRNACFEEFVVKRLKLTKAEQSFLGVKMKKFKKETTKLEGASLKKWV